MNPPAVELVEHLNRLPPGRALDLACGSGRHAIWLRDRGWAVTAVDIAMESIDGVNSVQADLEQSGFVIAEGSWDLIVCWLYWQESLLPAMAAGVRPGGVIAVAGKITGRFATSLERYREAFGEWEEICSGQDDYKVFLIARKPDVVLKRPG